jgi:hypothetical protein
MVHNTSHIIHFHAIAHPIVYLGSQLLFDSKQPTRLLTCINFDQNKTSYSIQCLGS